MKALTLLALLITTTACSGQDDIDDEAAICELSGGVVETLLIYNYETGQSTIYPMCQCQDSEYLSGYRPSTGEYGYCVADQNQGGDI